MDLLDGHLSDILITGYLDFGKEGKVYRAVLGDTHQLIAIKCIERWEDKIVSLRKIFDFCKQLEHPNIVRHLYHRPYPSFQPLEPPVYQVIMEHCRGGTLRQTIRRTHVTPYLLRKWTKEIVEGLSYLHEKHCVHRDLKGDNILMTSKNLATSSVKTGDLSTIAMADEVLPGYGTYPFMAPEMIADQNPDTCEAQPKRGLSVDIWSLGCVVIEMLNGIPPQFFRECDGDKVKITGEHAVLYFVMTGGFPTIPMGLPADIDHFVRACLQRKPCDRISATELKRHRFLTAHESVLSNWVLPEPIGEIKLQGRVEGQMLAVGGQRNIPLRFIRMIDPGGGMSEVFQTVRTDTNEIVEVKVIGLDLDPMDQENHLKQLKADLQMFMALHHPNIARYIHQQQAAVQSVYDRPSYQILMEFYEGPVLWSIVRETKIPLPLLQKWTNQLVEAVSYLHSQHCVHGNINNRNILLSSKDVDNCLVKICGFGVTKGLQGKTTKTHEFKAVGSARYPSPEMISGKQPVGKKTDIWSLGCVVLEMVTGVAPRYHKEESDGHMLEVTGDMAVTYFVGNGGSPTIPEDLPAQLEHFISSCFIQNPSDRPCAADLERHGFLTADHNELLKWVLPPQAN